MVSIYLLPVFMIGLHCAYAKRVYIDMTYTLTNATITWPGDKPFKLVEVFKGKTGTLDWFAINNLETVEHIGTHMDAPYHFNEKGWKIHQIPFERLHGPAVIINIERRAKRNRDAMAYASDLQYWEKRNGRIPDGAFVLLNSGWSRFWGDQLKFVGSFDDATKLHFPGFSEDAAKWLAKYRPKISAVGSDSISCDAGISTSFPTHVIMTKLNIMCLENIANLHKLPESGAEVIAMPIKIRGTGAPIRMFAVLGHNKPEFPFASNQPNLATHYHLLMSMIVFSFMSFM